MVSIELPEVVTEVGAKVAVAPVGRPAAPRVTEPVKPLSAPTFTVKVAALPGFTDAVAGVAVSEKSGAVMVNVTGAV
jgi:hypothetical protein